MGRLIRQNALAPMKLWGALLLIGLATGPISAQSVLLRPNPVPVLPEPLDPSLGVKVDSLRHTPGGVLYRDLAIGNGDDIRIGDQIAVRFVGFLANGTMVTESAVEPTRFRVGEYQVIIGWEEGVLGMRVGGRRQLIIPPALGYGNKASGPVPANSTLIFDIIIVDRKGPD